MDPQDFLIQDGEPVSDKGDHRSHADQKRKRIFDKSDGGIDFYSPATKFFLAKPRTPGTIRNPTHDQAIHRRDHRNGQDDQPYRSAEGYLGNPSDNN